MVTNEGRVYFALDGNEFKPNELTQFLDIRPTTVKIKGEKFQGHLSENNSWILSSENEVSTHIDVYEISKTIINQLKPKKEAILKAIKQFNISPRLEVVLLFSVDDDVPTPAIGFDAETIEFFGGYWSIHRY